MSLIQHPKSQLAIAVMAVSASIAQAGQTSTLLDQVTVTATRTERTLDDVASSVSVVTTDDAEKNMAQDIRDLIKYEPGVNVSSDSRFGLGSFNIRGMDQNRVKITVDGVDQAKAFGYERTLQSQRNFFDIENMKVLEIVKGPASSIHGSDAIGGVVSFITKDPSDYLKAEGDDSYASIKAGYRGADSSFSESLTLANRTGDLESLVVYTRRDGKEQKTYGGRGGDGESREQADPLDYSSDSLLGKVQYQLNDTNRIGFTAEWLGRRSQSDLLSMQDYTIVDVAVGGIPMVSRVYSNNVADDKVERTRLGFFHEWDADLQAFDTMKWSIDWQESETTQKTSDTFESIVKFPGGTHTKRNRYKTYSYNEESVQADLLFNKSLALGSTEHYLTYGANFEQKRIANENKIINDTTYNVDTGEVTKPADVNNENWMPNVSITQYSGFVQDEIGFFNDRLLVTPGIRYDHFEEKIKSTDNYDNNGISTSDIKDASYDSWTARLGSVYEINDTWSTFAQYSQGFRAPDMFSKYFTYSPSEMPDVKVIANPDLKPEESDTFELGLRANNQLGSMEVTGFYNQYKNFIEERCIENCGAVSGTFQYQNLSEATIYGAEFKGMLWLDQVLSAPAGTRLNTAIAWSRGRGTKVDDNGNIRKDEPLNTISPLTAVIGLGYDAPSNRWGSDLVWTLVAGKDSDDISNLGDVNTDGNQGEEHFASPGYGLVDLTAYYKPYKDITINAGIFNMTDKKYWVWNDVRNLTASYQGLNRYTQPGRNYSISVKWEI